MTATNDLDRQLDAFLEDGPTELPLDSFTAVRDRTDQTRQRVLLGPWRVPAMNKIVPIAVGAAAVVAVLVVGAQVLRPSTSTGVAGQPAATAPATATATPAATATATPAVTSGAALPSIPAKGPISAGTYLMSDGVSTISLTVPDGWEAAGEGDLRKHWDQLNEAGFFLHKPDINVFADVCKTDVAPQATGPTTADLVAALKAQAGSEVSEPEAVTVGGSTGVRLTVTIPAGFDFAACPDRGAKIWSAVGGGNWLAFGERPDAQSATIYIVDGPSGRIVYGPGASVGASDADRAELDSIVRSISVEPAP